MSIIDKVCGKMGLMDPEDNIDFEEEELSRKAEPKHESFEEEMDLGKEHKYEKS